MILEACAVEDIYMFVKYDIFESNIERIILSWLTYE